MNKEALYLQQQDSTIQYVLYTSIKCLTILPQII